MKRTTRKVIFLDIDGVINSGNNMEINARLKRTEETMYFDPVCMKLLKELVEDTGADLILSSDWRFPDEQTKSICHLQNLMKRLADYEIGLAGQTGKALIWRNDEINEWLQAHPEVESYVILDDVNDNFEGENLKRLVLTDEVIGLTAEDIAKAARILREQIAGREYQKS